MKKILAVLLMIVPSFLCGCQASLGGFGGLSIWSAAATKVVVSNNTKDLRLVVLKNGEVKNKYYVQPGGSFVLPLYNFGEPTREFVVVVKAVNSDGEVVGMATRHYNVAKYKDKADPWVINIRNLEMSK